MPDDYPHPIIAREGWTFLAIAIVAAALLTGLGYVILAILAWLVVAFIAQFFRDVIRRHRDIANIRARRFRWYE